MAGLLYDGGSRDFVTWTPRRWEEMLGPNRTAVFLGRDREGTALADALDEALKGDRGFVIDPFRLGLWRIPASSGYQRKVNPSYPFDPHLHRPGSVAARGGCSWHGSEGVSEVGCEGEPVVSFRDEQSRWHSGCERALEDLVDRGEIEPLGQGV